MQLLTVLSLLLVAACGTSWAAQDMTLDSHNHSDVHNVHVPCDVMKSNCFRDMNMAVWNVTGGNITLSVSWLSLKTEMGECKQGFFEKWAGKAKTAFDAAKERVANLRNKRMAKPEGTGTAVVNVDHLVEFMDNPTCCVVLPYAVNQWGHCSVDTTITTGCCASLQKAVEARSSAGVLVSSLVSVLMMLVVGQMLV